MAITIKFKYGCRFFANFHVAMPFIRDYFDTNKDACMSVQLDDAHIHMSQEAFNIPGAIPFLDKRSRNSKKTIVTFFIKPVLTDNHYNTLCLLKHDTKTILNSINKMKEHYTENEQLAKAMKSISSHLDKATSILSQIIEHND